MSELMVLQQQTTETTVPQPTSAETDPADTATPEQTEAEKRKAHEEAEAKRKAEWEAKRQEREARIRQEWQEATELSDEELTEQSVQRLARMIEQLTHRNMKLCVAEHVQMLCYENSRIAQLALHPRKSMLNCFKYINARALEYLKQEQKQQQDTGEHPVDSRVIGGDVPDELCYQWAEDYFRDLDAAVDKTEEDAEFKPQPYRGSTASKAKKKSSLKPAPKAETPPPASKPTEEPESVQMSLWEGAA